MSIEDTLNRNGDYYGKKIAEEIIQSEEIKNNYLTQAIEPQLKNLITRACRMGYKQCYKDIMGLK